MGRHGGEMVGSIYTDAERERKKRLQAIQKSVKAIQGHRKGNHAFALQSNPGMVISRPHPQIQTNSLISIYGTHSLIQNFHHSHSRQIGEFLRQCVDI